MQHPGSHMTYSQFLDFIADHPDGQYEYIDGRPVAMGRPSTIHQRIAGELFVALKSHLRGQRCDVYFDVRTWVGTQDRVPDLAVTCDEYDMTEATNVIHYPKLIVEILSPKRADDLDLKLKQYENLPSVLEYIVIDARHRWLARYARPEAMMKFEIDPIRISGSVVFTSVGYSLDIDELYRLARFEGNNESRSS